MKLLDSDALGNLVNTLWENPVSQVCLVCHLEIWQDSYGGLLAHKLSQDSLLFLSCGITQGSNGKNQHLLPPLLSWTSTSQTLLSALS